MSSTVETAAAVRPFHVDVPDEDLADLRRRIVATRWPEKETVADQSQGVPLATTQALADYWATEYDWRRCQDRLNGLPQFVTEIDGLDIHYIHVRSKHEDALPLIVNHGWPGSIIEQLKIIEPLTDPTEHGATAADAFHVVIPSMPGYGFSGKPRNTGCPQTLYGIADSPVGLAAWLLDHNDADGQPAAAVVAALGRPRSASGELTRDEVLDNITLYWLTNTAVSASRLYWEYRGGFFNAKGVSIPVAVTVFPGEQYQAPRSWAERAYPNLIYYNEVDKGGHFAAWEQPELFAAELRAAFRSLR